MNIYICTKQVPGTDQPIKIKADGSGIDTEGITFDISPYDEYAIEEALKMKEALGAGTVTVVTLGPDRALEVIRHALAMGADEGIHLKDSQFDDLDPAQIAWVLAQVLKGKNPDLVWTGKQAVDDDMAMVGPALAEYLGLPHVTEVKKLELAADRKSMVLHREVEGGAEVVCAPLPAVLTAQKGLNSPRYKSLKGIMAAKKKKVETLDAAALGLDVAKLSADARQIRVRKYALPAAKQTVQKRIEGTVEDMVKETVRILREEVKLI